MNPLSQTLISIVGPTAVGKTQLALAWAEKYQAPILSCDARQIYRYMDIGTAKPSQEERERVPHYFMDILEPDTAYSAGQFARDAEQLIYQLFQKHAVILLVGGSTLYAHALWVGFDEMPEIDPTVRDQLNQQLTSEGLTGLLKELMEVDPVTYATIDQQNPARVIRALEVFRSSGKPISFFRRNMTPRQFPFRMIKIGLTSNRDALYERINLRVDHMLEQGLVQEVHGLLKQGYSPQLNALQTIGYREVISHLQGEFDHTEMVRLIKRNSRRYAKRQLTFFRRYPDIQWANPSQISELQNSLHFPP